MTLKSQDLDKLAGFHIVIVCTEFSDNNQPQRVDEQEAMKKVLEVTKL